MATYSFPALGFDPAPGDPDAIDAVAWECQRCARDLAQDADQLKRLTQGVDWKGVAANAFAAHPNMLHHDLVRASDAHGGTGSALASYAAALRQAQLDARRLEHEAAEARARADRHAAEADRLAQSIGVVPVGANSLDVAAQQSAAQRLRGYAEDDYQLAMTRARAVERTQQATGDRAASRIRSLSEAPYHEPGLLSQMVHGVADWVDKHADVLREISNVLKTASAIAGLLSFIPALTPIFAPIAALTAGSALVIDTALVATGHGEWKALAVDVALMALPGAGRIASRAVMASKAGGALDRYAQDVEVLALPSRLRPRTGASLSSRNVGKNLFAGGSRGADLPLHPRLVKALDDVPENVRKGYHGNCAEIRVINEALQEGARLRGAVIRTEKLRPPGHPEHGMAHEPCPSCRHVLKVFGVQHVE